MEQGTIARGAGAVGLYLGQYFDPGRLWNLHGVHPWNTGKRPNPLGLHTTFPQKPTTNILLIQCGGEEFLVAWASPSSDPHRLRHPSASFQPRGPHE